MQKSKTLWLDSRKPHINYSKKEKFIKLLSYKLWNTRQNVISYLETVFNFNDWKDTFFIKFFDWTITCLLIITTVLFILSGSKVLLAIGIFIGLEICISYLKQIKDVFN